MISKNLISALEELNFNYVDNKNSSKSHAYGIYGGYLITVSENGNKKIAYFNFKFPDNEENALKRYDMSEAFTACLEEYNITDYTISEDGMRIVSNGSTSSFLKLIDHCISLLSENQIRGIEYCSKCGNKFGSRNPKKVYMNSENHIMCEHCALETVEEYNDNTVNSVDTTQNHAGKSIISSILFSLIGTVIYFILYYWISPSMSESGLNEVRYIFCAAGFLVALLAYFGYTLFSKKASLAAYITVSVNALIFTAIGQFLGVVFEFIAKENFAVKALSNKHFWFIHLRNTIPVEQAANFIDHSAIFYKLLMISLMFAVVGAAIFLLTLHDKSVIKSEPIEVETIKIQD